MASLAVDSAAANAAANASANAVVAMINDSLDGRREQSEGLILKEANFTFVGGLPLVDYDSHLARSFRHSGLQWQIIAFSEISIDSLISIRDVYSLISDIYLGAPCDLPQS